MHTITTQSLKTLIGKVNIIDIRSISSYNNNHIDTAKNIEYSLLIREPNKYLKKTEKYYFYCQRGVKSYKLCLYLDRLGFDVTNVIGGYESYILDT